MANTQDRSFHVQRSKYPFARNLRGLKAVAWNNTIIVLGGYTNVSVTEKSVVYFHRSGEWVRQETSGDIPEIFHSNVKVEVLNNKIILVNTITWAIYSLCPNTWTWTKIKAWGQHPAAPHTSSWVHNEKIYCFGIGTFTNHYSNELLCYNPLQNSWELTYQSGDIPSPRYAHATIIDDDTVFLFGGGQHPNQVPIAGNDLFMLDMSRMHWTKIHEGMERQDGQGIPHQVFGYQGTGSTLTLVSKSAAILFVSIPYSSKDPTDECWLLNIDMAKQLKDPSHIWTRIPNKFTRIWYAAVKEPLSNSLWLIGGYDRQTGKCTTDVLKISPRGVTLKDLALDYIASNIGSNDRRLLEDQIPKQLKNEIQVHRYKY